MHRPQLLDDEVLGKVGVLVLVDKDVLEAVLVLAEQVRKITQQDIHLEQQIVKVHGARAETSDLILGEDVREHGPTCLLVLRPNLGILCIGPGVQQVVLGRTDPRLNPCGLVRFVVQPHAFDDVLQKASAVLGVVDGEIAGVVDALALDPKDACENAVEGPHPKVACLTLSHQAPNAGLHFLGRLVGEGQGQNGKGVHALRHKVGNPVGQHPRFSRACAGDDHHGTIFVLGRFPLHLVQVVEKIHSSKVRSGDRTRKNLGLQWPKCGNRGCWTNPTKKLPLSLVFSQVSSTFAPPLKIGGIVFMPIE